MVVNQESLKEAEAILFTVSGGIGRNIQATAVVRAIKKAYPDKKLSVICGCPDVFLKSPYIHKVYNLGSPAHVYEPFFKETKTVLINVEPYQHYDYIYKKKHFVECWCEQIGVPCDGIYPEIFFTDNENRMAEIQINAYEKDFILCQFLGGKLPQNDSEREKLISEFGMYKRSIPQKVQQGIVDSLINKGFTVGVVCDKTQFCPSMAVRINQPIRAIVSLLPYVSEVIAIDSFLQHATACFKKKSLVVWGGTSPKVLGYDSNMNLTKEACDSPMCHRPNSYLWDFESNGFAWDCPHNEACLKYTVEEIINAFDEMTNKRVGKPKGERKVVNGERKEADCNCPNK